MQSLLDTKNAFACSRLTARRSSPFHLQGEAANMQKHFPDKR
jgi:hypothetical protein